MTDCPELLAAVLSAPDEDAPRLVYADWCDENGQPGRAEFIRLQVEIAAKFNDWVCLSHDEPRRTNGHSYASCGHCPPCVLRDRLGRLTSENLRDWAAGYGMDHRRNYYWFQRGFLNRASVRATDWLAIGKQLVTVAPLELVHLSDCRPAGEAGHFSWLSDRVYPAGARYRSSSYLPHAIWELLPGRRSDQFLPVAYPSEQVAVLALSEACLKWAKS
jgi:uncharacterized protein (TIGR02996 family)